jgi:hypothetical protein
MSFFIRFALGAALVTTIWIRVDWSVGLFALLSLIRAELEDYLRRKS